MWPKEMRIKLQENIVSGGMIKYSLTHYSDDMFMSPQAVTIFAVVGDNKVDIVLKAG